MGDSRKSLDRLRKVGESLSSFTSSVGSLRARLVSPTNEQISTGAVDREQPDETPTVESEESVAKDDEDVEFQRLKDLLQRVNAENKGSVELQAADWAIVSAALRLLVDSKIETAEKQFLELGKLLAGEKGEKVRLVEAYRRMGADYDEMEKRLGRETEERVSRVKEIKLLKERVDNLEKNLLKARREAIENESHARTAVRRLDVFKREFEDMQKKRKAPEEVEFIEADRDRLGVMVKQLQYDLDQADQKLERERIEKRTLKDNVESLEKLTVVLRSDLSKCQGRRVRRIEVESLKVKLAEAKAEVEGLRARLVHESRDRERRGEQRVRERVGALEREAEGREKVLHEIKTERDKLKGFILRYEAELKRKERALDKLRTKIQRTSHSQAVQNTSVFTSGTDNISDSADNLFTYSTSTGRGKSESELHTVLPAQSSDTQAWTSDHSSRSNSCTSASKSRESRNDATGSNLLARMDELEAQVRSLQGSEDGLRNEETGFWQRGSSYEEEGEE